MATTQHSISNVSELHPGHHSADWMNNPLPIWMVRRQHTINFFLLPFLLCSVHLCKASSPSCLCWKVASRTLCRTSLNPLLWYLRTRVISMGRCCWTRTIWITFCTTLNIIIYSKINIKWHTGTHQWLFFFHRGPAPPRGSGRLVLLSMLPTDRPGSDPSPDPRLSPRERSCSRGTCLSVRCILSRGRAEGELRETDELDFARFSNKIGGVW